MFTRQVRGRTTLRCLCRRLLSTSAIADVSVNVNNVSYRLPRGAVVGLLMDGCSQEYIDAAAREHRMPNVMRILQRTVTSPSSPSAQHRHKFTPTYDSSSVSDNAGVLGLVSAVMPTFTNPNNVAVIAGAPPAVTGISGNYYYDTEQQREVSMTDSSLIQCPTILQTLNERGVHVTVVTAKDKLLRLLKKGLNEANSTAVSVETLSQSPADDPTRQRLEAAGVHVGQVPTIYDPMCSVYAAVLARNILHRDMIKHGVRPHIVYISTTDYMQHTYAPGHENINDFYAAMDTVIGSIHTLTPSSAPLSFPFTSSSASSPDAFAHKSPLSVTFGLTADHGMNDKVGFDGRPRIVYLQTILEEAGIHNARIILPITDAHIRHHGSLGSYATIYTDKPQDVMKLLRPQSGIYTVLSGDEAVKAFDLPRKRIGDVIVIGSRETVLGKNEEFHREGLQALSGVTLRSHGGIDEMTVPMMINKPINSSYLQKLNRGKLRNFHLFDLLLNATE